MPVSIKTAEKLQKNSDVTQAREILNGITPITKSTIDDILSQPNSLKGSEVILQASKSPGVRLLQKLGIKFEYQFPRLNKISPIVIKDKLIVFEETELAQKLGLQNRFLGRLKLRNILSKKHSVYGGIFVGFDSSTTKYEVKLYECVVDGDYDLAPGTIRYWSLEDTDLNSS